MKKILIPTNFSRNSNVAINYVTELLKEEYCEFYFLNTYSYDVSGLNAIELLPADDAFFDEPKEESLRQLGALVEHCTLDSDNDKHSFYAISENSGLIESIKTNVEKIGIDLVIVSGNSNKTVGKNTGMILEKVRTCPVLIAPPNTSICKGLCITIASDFKLRINTIEIDKFIKTFKNTKLDIEILVLEEQKNLTAQVASNLESLSTYLKQLLEKESNIEFIQSGYGLKEYAASHNDHIICIIDKKPDLLRKIGFYKSNVISTIGKLRTNTVLTIHQ